MLNNIRETLIIPKESREYFLPLNEFLRKNGILLAGTSYLTKGYKVIRMKSSFHIVIFTFGKEGRFIDHVDRKTYNLKQNSLLCFPAHRLHHFESLPDGWNMMWFHLDDIPRWKMLFEKTPAHIEQRNFQALLQAEQRFIEEADSASPEAMSLSQLYGEIIYRLLSRELDFTMPTSEFFIREKMNELWQRLSASPEKKWTCAKMASEMNMSVQHFSRMCGKIYGTSPKKKLAEIRMKRATELMSFYNYTVNQAADAVGYNNPFAFSAAFKKLLGYPPSAGVRRFPEKHKTKKQRSWR